MNSNRFFVNIFIILFLSVHYIFSQTLPVYPDNEISKVYIVIDPDSLDIILEEGNEASDYEYPATFIFNNSFVQDTITNIGFRLRGNTSRYSQKKSFKVSFNTFQPGLKFYGYEKLNLNGEHNDPSIIRSKLSWDLFKILNVPSTDASYVRLYINDTYFGLYVNVEHIDETFVNRNYNNSDGNLYKCLWPADLTYISQNPDDYKSGNDDRRTYDLKTNRQLDDYSDLANFIDLLNNTPLSLLPAELETHFHVDQYLRILAVDALTGSWDNYWFLKNNFYLYHNSATGKFEFIPYDYDNSFGIWWDGILSGVDWGTRNIYAWGNPYEPRPLATRILEIPQYRNRYSYYLNYLLEVGFRPEILNAKIDSIFAMISDAAAEDEYRTYDYGYTVDDFIDSYDNALGDHVTYGLKPYIETRYNSALQQISMVNVAPYIFDVAHYPRAIQSTDSIKFVAEIRDDSFLEMVKLFYMEEGVWLNSDMAISFTDGKEALNEFSCTITLPPFESGEQLHYYIAAVDDSGAVVSLPIGAPRNHFTTKIGYQNPKLYINEFLASNDSLFADNFGEYDDWLEIYNGDSESINLKGFYLSDNFANPGKWAFPDTVIESGGFMLLWADEDQEQGPLHLNFKLSRNGEQLGIFNSDTTNFAPVDTLTFDLQVPNISFGRYPDGTLTWEKFDSPTPGSANQTTSIISDNTFLQPSEFRLDQNYPNPFNPVTAIGYRLSAISQVELSVYNLLGQKIAVLVSERQNAGSYQVEWDASGFTSGIYFYRLQTDGGFIQTRKLMLIK